MSSQTSGFEMQFNFGWLTLKHFSVWASQSAWHGNIGWTNGVSLGQDYLFAEPMQMGECLGKQCENCLFFVRFLLMMLVLKIWHTLSFNSRLQDGCASLCMCIITVIHVPLTVITARDLNWCDKACFKLHFSVFGSPELSAEALMSVSCVLSWGWTHTLMNVPRGLQMKWIFQHCHFFSLFHPSVSPASSSSILFLLFSVVFLYHPFSLCLCLYWI